MSYERKGLINGRRISFRDEEELLQILREVSTVRERLGAMLQITIRPERIAGDEGPVEDAEAISQNISQIMSLLWIFVCSYRMSKSGNLYGINLCTRYEL